MEEGLRGANTMISTSIGGPHNVFQADRLKPISAIEMRLRSLGETVWYPDKKDADRLNADSCIDRRLEYPWEKLSRRPAIAGAAFGE